MPLKYLALNSNDMKNTSSNITIYFICVRILVGARDFSLLYNLEAVPRAQPASYSVGNGTLSAGVGV